MKPGLILALDPETTFENAFGRTIFGLLVFCGLLGWAVDLQCRKVGGGWWPLGLAVVVIGLGFWAVPFANVFGLVVPVILAGIVGPIMWHLNASIRKGDAHLQMLAGQTGLTFIPAEQPMVSSRLTGLWRGRPVDVFPFVIGAGKYSQDWLAVSAWPAPDSGLTFTLWPRRFSRQLGKQRAPGKRELTTGDSAFDAAWFAQSNQPEFFTAALRPALRAKLMAARAAGSRGTFEMQDGAVRYEEKMRAFTAKNCACIPLLLDVLCDLAEVADAAPPQFSRQPNANPIPP